MVTCPSPPHWQTGLEKQALLSEVAVQGTLAVQGT